MTLATFARIQHYGDGTPDPRTATCQQHMVAAPYSDTAKGDGTTIPFTTMWECVVCPHPDADLIGTEVIARGFTGTYTYGGNDKDRGPGFVSVEFSLRYGGLPVVRGSVLDVAPASTPVNEKDPRITITKLPKKRDYQDNGPWLMHIDHPAFSDFNPRAEKTKRDALAGAANRLAIADYHDARRATQGSAA